MLSLLPLLLLLLLLLPPLRPIMGSAPPPAPPPHLVVVVGDDFGSYDGGSYRGGKIPTPAVDSLTRDGLVMDRPVPHSPWACVLTQTLRAVPRSHSRAPLQLPLPPSHCNATTASADRTATHWYCSREMTRTPRPVCGSALLFFF